MLVAILWFFLAAIPGYIAIKAYFNKDMNTAYIACLYYCAQMLYNVLINPFNF